MTIYPETIQVLPNQVLFLSDEGLMSFRYRGFMTRGFILPELPSLSSDAEVLENSEATISTAFRELAIHDLIPVKHEVLNMLAAEIEWLKEIKPDLTDVERARLAGKLLQHRIRCYQHTLDQLL